MDNSSSPKLCIFLSPRKSLFFNHSGEDVPKWFSLPLEQLIETHFTDTASKINAIAGPRGFLFFNISKLEVISTLIYGSQVPICSLFQWIPLEQLPWVKRLCYQIVLRRSGAIVTYNQIAYDYIKQRFPGKKVYFLRLWIDTEFFRPQPIREIPTRFLLCPGSHRRDEHKVCQLASALGIPIVRFSQNPEAIEFYRTHSHEFVDFRYDISYTEMRQLYNDATVVINLVDDHQIPAGLTCFIEALSMNCTVITPSGHSSAGYEFPNGQKPYYTVSSRADIEEWKQAAETALAHPITDGSPRRYAEQYASAEAAKQLWREVLKDMDLAQDKL